MSLRQWTTGLAVLHGDGGQPATQLGDTRAKMTLYRNFASKDDLILAFLARRETLWAQGWVQAESRRRGDTPVRQASVQRLANIRSYLCDLAAEAGVEDSDSFARQWHILMKGSIIAAAEGDTYAATRAQELGILLLDHHGIPTA